MKYILLTLTLLLAACGDNAAETLRKQQEALTKQQAQLYQQEQQLQQQQQQPQYQQQVQQPQYQQQAQAPIIVQQPMHNSNSQMTDMLVGGMIGHALANSGSRNGPSYNPPQQVTNVTRNVTINQRPSPISSRGASMARSSRR